MKALVLDIVGYKLQLDDFLGVCFRDFCKKTQYFFGHLQRFVNNKKTCVRLDIICSVEPLSSTVELNF